MSVVESNRKQLEAIGDYVTRANVNWFAVFPDKLAEFEQVAAANSRESHLIVYRTRSDDARDHHVIPISILSELFTDESLTHSDVNQTIRWNATLNDHILRVSHNDLSVDVSQFFGLPLAIELNHIASVSHAADLNPPATQRVASTVYRILRDTELAKQLKQDYEFCCQICGHTIELPDGTRYAEAHHIRPLGRPHGGPDCAENVIVLCPNHHAMCDYGAIRLVLDDLHVINCHDIDPKFIAYHNNTICPTAVDA
jgi:5-methylcytosine-specific restriction endonuclease McrA